MTFTTFSLFLGGLTATAVPVLLHLLMRGKPKQIEFPALMFIVKRLETHRRNYRLKQLILLAMRMLALILFGLALARPTIKLADWFSAPVVSNTNKIGTKRHFVSTLAASLGSQDAPIAAAVVIDTSPRMEYVSENQSRLEVAKEFSRWILSQLPTDSEIAVLSTERETPVFQVDRLAAEEKVDRLRTALLGKPVAEAVRDALTLLAQNAPDDREKQQELYVVTDLSEPGWPGDLGSLKNLIAGMRSGNGILGNGGQDLGLFVIDVSADTPVNSSVIRLSPVPEITAERSPVKVDFELAHIGPATTKTVELLLTGLSPEEPGKETVRSAKSVDFSEGESRKHLSFTLSGFEPGTHQGKIRFSVTDALPTDDQAWFTVQVQSPWKILLLAQPPVLDRSLYLREALDPRETLEPTPFEVETASLAGLSGMTARELSQYRAVILLDPMPLEPTVWKKLADYASSGRGIGVFLGGNADVSFNEPAALEIIGAKLVRQSRDLDGETWITAGHGTSPVFTPFRQIQPLDRFPWDAQPIFRYWAISDLSPQADVAAAFSDGRPAMLTQTLGRGRTLTLLTPVSETVDERQPWNLLTRGDAAWMFMLLAEGMSRYLVGMGDDRFNFQAGGAITLRPDVEALPASCLMGTPSGESVRLTPDVARGEIVVPTVLEPGNYRIRSGGARGSLDTGFSVNISGESMNLRKVDKTRLDDLLGEGNYRLARTPQEIEIGIARRRIGQELYALIMIVLAGLFAAEYVFSNRFYPDAKAGNEASSLRQQ